MPINNLSLFIAVTFVVSASPGPVMLSCMNNGGRFGVKAAITGMLGASLSNMILMMLSTLGLGLLISQNDLLFNGLKWAGAGYLAFMGWQIIRTPMADNANPQQPSDRNPKSLFLNSLLIALSNPKGFIYFGALYPEFINYQKPLSMQLLFLAVVFLTTDLLWMFAYAAAGNSIMQWLTTAKHQRIFNVISGAVLIAAGIFIVLSGKNS